MSEERQQPNSRPSSSSLFWGLWRQGLKDAQNAVLNPWNGVTATHEEPGTIASPTQAVVTQEIGTVARLSIDARRLRGAPARPRAGFGTGQVGACRAPARRIGARPWRPDVFLDRKE